MLANAMWIPTRKNEPIPRWYGFVDELA